MTCRGLPCAGQMARLRGMITQIALGSLAAAPMPAPRPARARPAGVPDAVAAAVAVPDAPASTPVRGHSPLPTGPWPKPGADAVRRGRPNEGREAAGVRPTRRQHDDSGAVDLPRAGLRANSHDESTLQQAPPHGMRRPHPPARSPLLSLQERGSTPADRPGSEPAPSAAPRERLAQMSVLPGAGASARRPAAPAGAADVPPLSARQRGPTGTPPGPEPLHHRRPRPAAATVTQGDAAWQEAYGLRRAHDATVHPAHAPPPLSDTALRGPAGRLHEDAPAAAPDAEARERQMRLDAAR